MGVHSFSISPVFRRGTARRLPPFLQLPCHYVCGILASNSLKGASTSLRAMRFLKQKDAAEERLDTKEALNRFLASVEVRAFRMTEFSVGDPDEALDLVQDAMLGFVSRYSSRPESEWAAVFYRILQNRITDWYRRTAVRNRFRAWFGNRDDDQDNDEDPIQTIADTSSPDPDKSLCNSVAADALKSAVGKLPLRQRQAFLLRAWEGMDVAKTAYAMGCSEGSVKTHYSRAVHTLRGLLEEFRP
jgi:RNA polymerase sigma-70 factor, ECF subfamily